MAWISVHEQIIGGKLRELSKAIGCSQNEALGLLVRFWLWGINNADKEGKIIGADKSDIAEILTVGIDKRYAPEDVADALIENKWIDDMEYGLYIHDWKEWQKQWYKALDTREKDAARKRKEREKGEKKQAICDSEQKSMQVQDNDKNVAKECSSKKPKAEYPNDFKEFWDVYPRKIGQGEAYKKYKARLKDGWSPGELKTAAIRYADFCTKNKTENEYIKHAKTFLSDSTPFVDYLKQNDQCQMQNTFDEDDPYKDWR